jgi:hypothetical protein
MHTCPVEVGLDPRGLGDGGRQQSAQVSVEPGRVDLVRGRSVSGLTWRMMRTRLQSCYGLAIWSVHGLLRWVGPLVQVMDQ